MGKRQALANKRIAKELGYSEEVQAMAYNAKDEDELSTILRNARIKAMRTSDEACVAKYYAKKKGA